MKTGIYTVILNEQDYLEDWIRYHLELGVDALFIFEDMGSLSHKSICDKYDNVILKPILSLFNDEEKDRIIQKKKDGKFVQSDYAHKGLNYIKNNHPDIDWCFSLDIDEYISPTEPFPSLLERYNDYDAVMLYWLCFGASGHIRKPVYDKPIWEIYTTPCGYFSGDWKNRNITKMVYNMRKLQDKFIWGVHTALCNWVRTDFSTKRSDPPCFDVIYIRHFITKSWEEFCTKLFKRGMFCGGYRKIDNFFEVNPDLKERYDECMKVKEEIMGGF